MIIFALLLAISYAQTELSSRRLLTDHPDCSTWKAQYGDCEADNPECWCDMPMLEEAQQCSECTAPGDAIPKQLVKKIFRLVPYTKRKTKNRIEGLSNWFKNFCLHPKRNCRQEDIDAVDTIVQAIDVDMFWGLSETEMLLGYYDARNGKPIQTLPGTNLHPKRMKKLLKTVGPNYLAGIKNQFEQLMRKIMNKGLTLNGHTEYLIRNLYHHANDRVQPVPTWLHMAERLYQKLLLDYNARGEPKF